MSLSNDLKSIIKKYINGFDIIYWINLDRATDRRKKMMKFLSYIPKQNIRITGIDGVNDSSEMFAKINCVNIENCNNSEIACCLSHLNTLKMFAESDYEIALILEDDIYSFDFLKYWNKDIKTIMNEAPSDWEILTLTCIVDDINSLNNTYTSNNTNKIWGAGAYLIKKSGAKKLIDSIYNNNIFKIDKDDKPISDIYIFTKLKTYNYKYAYFIYPSINNSQIHEEHLGMQNKSKNILINIWEDSYKERNVEHFNNITLLDKNNYVIFILMILFIFFILLNYKT